MRTHLVVLAGLVLAGSLLAGCGSDAEPTATEPTVNAPATPSQSVEPVSAEETCAALYHPPQQLMPRAIEFVFGSPSAEGASEAAALVDDLVEVAGRAPVPLPDDLAIVREAVDAQRAALQSGSGGPDQSAFDGAVHRLARHCAPYNR